MGALRISSVTVTPVAFADPPLLNSVGVHEPFALRAVVEVNTDDGLSGLGETYADERHLAALRAAAAAIAGADAYHTEQIYRRVQAIAAPETTIASGLIGDSSATDRVFSPFEVACLDIQGQAAGRPVADLLGGAVRDAGAVRLPRRRDPRAGRARARGRARPGRAGPAARAVPAVRPAQPGRHRLHAPRRSRLGAQATALVAAGRE